MEENFKKTKQSVLKYVEQLFEEMEAEMAISHQEKYALLEDAFESAVDENELRVAFEQWYSEHSEDLSLDYDLDELWDLALGGLEE